MRKRVIRLVYEYSKGMITKEEYLNTLNELKQKATLEQIEVNQSLDLISLMVKSINE